MGILDKISGLRDNAKYTNEHLKGNNHEYQKFIVLTYRRSGANFFLDLLRSHPQIVAYAGLFEKDKVAFFYTGYPPVDCKSTLKYRDKYPVEFLQKRVFGTYSDAIKSVGFKIIYELKQQQVLEYLRAMPDLKIIHLQRKNLLRLHLSDKIAATTNKWHAVSKEHEQWVNAVGDGQRGRLVDDPQHSILPDDLKITLNYQECLKEFEKITRLRNEFKGFFMQQSLLDVYYEDLLTNLSTETTKVLSFLNVENQDLNSRFLKINNKKISDLITNYAQLKNEFAGSEWAQFFED